MHLTTDVEAKHKQNERLTGYKKGIGYSSSTAEVRLIYRSAASYDFSFGLCFQMIVNDPNHFVTFGYNSFVILYLHHAVRHTFSAKRRKYHFSGCDAKRADVDPAGQACYMTHDCKKAQQLASYFEERGT